MVEVVLEGTSNEIEERKDAAQPMIRCPPQDEFGRKLTIVFFIAMVFVLLWSLTESLDLPMERFLKLIVIYFSSHLFGCLASRINLPDITGMLISGVVLRNTIFPDSTLDRMWFKVLRGTALTIILLRAGMGLDPDALRHFSCAVFGLAFIPCIVEIISTAVAAYFLLEMPWAFSIMLGSVMGAVSPAVVVPGMLNLSHKGYGVEKGIPTFVIAACSIDDIAAISVFGVAVGLTFNEDHLVYTIIKCPIEIIIGTLYGMIFGVLLWYLPHPQQKRRTLVRLVMLLLFALSGYFVTEKIEYGGAGPLAVLLIGFLAQLRWRREMLNAESESELVSTNLGIVWTFCKPFLFGLIGYEVSLKNIELGFLGIAMEILTICLTTRLLATYFSVSCSSLNKKEKIFVAAAWIPKATVQIASMAALSILVTATLGTILISKLGPLLLSHSKDKTPPTSLEDSPVKENH